MRILQIIPYFTPTRGGDVNVCYNLSKELAELAKRKHDVTIATTDYNFDRAYAQTLETCGVQIMPLRNYANGTNLFISPGVQQWLKTEIKKYDIIHLHEYRSFQNIWVHKYAMKHGVPYVLQPHASTPRQTRKHIKWLFDVVFGRAILDDAGHIIAVSKEEEEFDKHLTQNEEITVIYNGIDLVAFINPPESSVFREKYGICDFAKRRAIPKNFSLHKKNHRYCSSLSLRLLESCCGSGCSNKNVALITQY